MELCYDDNSWKREYDDTQWRMELKVRSKVDFYDNAYNKWYCGRVIEMNEATKQVKVHQDGYSSNYDEWVGIFSDRIAEINVYTEPDPFWGSIL